MNVASARVRILIRVAGYALSALLACIFYVCWIATETSFSSPGSVRDQLFAALFFCVIGGFSAALLVMSALWIVVIWALRRIRRSTGAYFAGAGAILMVLVGCMASSLSPKLLFVEDQTFFEGVFIALERQGLCLALSGALLGLGYWFFAEKHCTSEGKLRTGAIRWKPGAGSSS